jgi:hypothetical protein
MAYDVTALSNYTQQNEKTLLVRSILSAATIEKIKAKGNVMTGVKTSSQLPNMDTDAVFQDGKGCGFTPSGTTKISTRQVTVGNIKVNEALCPADVEASFEQMNLTAGSQYTDIIFARDYSDLKVRKIAKAMEKAIWDGDTASADPQLKRFDGFRKIIKAATGVVDGNVNNVLVATGITKTNIADILDGLFLSVPEDLLDNQELVVFCGWDVFRTYILAMRDKNYYKDFKLDGSANEVTIIGTNLTLVATVGLSGDKELYLTHYGNLYFATDMLGEDETFQLIYADEADEVRFKAKWKAGVQIAFPEEVVKFLLK